MKYVHPWRLLGSFVIKTILSCIAVFPAVIFFADGLRGPLRNLITSIAPDFLEWYLVDMRTYWVAFIIVAVIIEIYFISIIREDTFPEKDYGSAQRLLAVLKSDNPKSALVSKKDMIEKNGGKDLASTMTSRVEEIVDENIQPIVSFLSTSASDKTLVLNSSWGTGKTSSILIAVDEFTKKNEKRKKVVDVRYIYESVFKYNGNLEEFTEDIIMSISKLLRIYGIAPQKEIEKLIKNIKSSNNISLLKNILYNNYSNISLTSEVINKINQKYIDNKRDFIIVVIIDDLDRLSGKDMAEVLSILSILRRFIFVKIIAPIDPNAVIKQLGAEKYYKPETFINKYLPEASSVKIKSGYDIAEAIALERMKGMSGNKKMSLEQFKPAWAAIIFRLITNKLAYEVDQQEYKRFRWLNGRNTLPATQPDWIKDGTILKAALINAPNYVKKFCTDFNNGSKAKYSWGNSGYSDIKYFNLIFSGMIDNRTGDRVMASFSDEKWNDVIEPWIYTFAEKHWSVFGFTVRDVIEIIAGIEDIQLNVNAPGLQFAQVYNSLFPDNQIKMKDKN
ncbi:hypothetical protein IJ798_03090 [Candidatus Saccharibacteria bacterium]|nr:hypothetical protein [Candidatus Saccharibacteria bacterium]